ncbi:hypothetical protein ACFL0V_04805 [Nanoarchaeota archaeon]
MRKLFKSRSANFNVLLMAIVTVVAGLVLIFVGVQIALKQSDIENNKKCQLSFFAASQMAKLHKKSYRVLDVPVSLECPRKELEIDAEPSVVKGGKIIDDLVKAKIANEIMSCWVKTGAGEMDPTKAGGWVWDSKERFCLICAEVSFSDKFQKTAKKQGYQLKGLGYWSAKRRIPGQKFTLWEFISGKKITDIKILKKLKESEDKYNIPMDFSDKFSIFWRADVHKPSALTGAVNWVSAAILVTTIAIAAVAITIASVGTAVLVIGAAVAAGATFSYGWGAVSSLSQGKITQTVHLAATNTISTAKPAGSKYVYCSFMFN